jgi:hypothetical protein
MNVKTYFDTKRKMTNYCNKETCNMNNSKCPFSILNNSKHVNCLKLEMDYPEIAVEIIEEYITKQFLEGYIICIRTNKPESINKCNKYISCTECMAKNR